LRCGLAQPRRVDSNNDAQARLYPAQHQPVTADATPCGALETIGGVIIAAIGEFALGGWHGGGMLCTDRATCASQIETAAMTGSTRAGAKVCPQSIAMKNKGRSSGNLEQDDRHFDHSGGMRIGSD
jgi:hypothetical protein